MILGVVFDAAVGFIVGLPLLYMIGRNAPAIRPPLMQLCRYLNIWRLESNYTHRFSLGIWELVSERTLFDTLYALRSVFWFCSVGVGREAHPHD